MFAALIAGTPIVVFPLVGLVLFFVFMAGVYVWAFLPSRKAGYEQIGKSIFDETPLVSKEH